MTRAHGNPGTAHARHGASGLSTRAVMAPHLSMLAAGLLALPFPPRTPRFGTRRPPRRVECPNDNIGVATVEGSFLAVGHPEPRSSTGNLSCDQGPDWDLYPIVILTDCEDTEVTDSTTGCTTELRNERHLRLGSRLPRHGIRREQGKMMRSGVVECGGHKIIFGAISPRFGSSVGGWRPELHLALL
jgi:hypothetical protein